MRIRNLINRKLLQLRVDMLAAADVDDAPGESGWACRSCESCQGEKCARCRLVNGNLVSSWCFC